MRKDLLDVVVSYLGDRALVIVRGQIDRDSVSTLRAVLDDLELNADTVIDMADVHFINSSGLTMLVAQAVRMRERDGELRIKNASPAVRDAVDMSDLGALLYGREDACESAAS
jgi:stage II sporulation protein AA (anti-sigma F factor antagonist)